MKGIRIVSRQAGFRRAGIAHPAEPTTYPLDKFTEEQLEALKDEPQLDVMDIELEEPKPEGDGKGKGGNTGK